MFGLFLDLNSVKFKLKYNSIIYLDKYRIFILFVLNYLYFLKYKKRDQAESLVYKNGGYDETWTCDPRIMSAVL